MAIGLCVPKCCGNNIPERGIAAVLVTTIGLGHLAMTMPANRTHPVARLAVNDFDTCHATSIELARVGKAYETLACHPFAGR